ncbi:MAG: tripartite tricarboxylate transporter substrate binding protein [Rhodospirillales bacterium]|nr:MAG: tripartite tricarboxylate transporter substrate binding protein [Rhodospirillales bacterium]
MDGYRGGAGTRRKFLASAGAALAAPTVVPGAVRAQAKWKPEKPITVYNPLAAGGVCDVHLRFLAERVSKALGQQVIVDVKAGAGATLAAAQMVNVKPDGHTIACMTINSLRYPHYQQANWHPLRDFSYITGLSEFTFGVVVKANSPWQTIEDLIAAGKKEPEKYNYGTSGIGGTGHLLTIEIEQASGAKFTHVPYKGGAEFVPALLGEHIHFVPDGAQWAPFVDSGQLRLLAMATPVRLPKYPDKPTLVERGINAIAVSPYGLVGPKDLPRAAIETLHEVYTEAMADPAHQPLLDKFIQVPWRKTPAEYRAFAEKYYTDVKPLLIKSGLAKA